MKNLKKSLGLLLCVVMFVTCLTACGSKTATTVSDFTDYFENEGFTVYDVSADYENISTTNVTDVLVARNETENYQIELFVFEDEIGSKGCFDANKLEIENMMTSSNYTSVAVNNYERYASGDNDNYAVVSRIDNTVVYVNVSLAKKDEVKKLLDGIGY